MEKWRFVEGTNGRILVSDQGRVKSLLRDGRILKATRDKKGYLRIRITLDGQKYAYKVHRLVANAFIPASQGKTQVNHINGDKIDNRACNLEWVTNKENANHAIKAGLWDAVFMGAFNENMQRRKAVTAFKKGEELSFKSISDAERYFNSRHISDVLKGKRKHVKGWTFRYAEGGDNYADNRSRDAERETTLVPD